jgi:iron complex transport system permease protein
MAAADPLRGLEAEPPRVLTRSRWLAILSVLAAASALVIVAALRLGAEDISWAAAARILLQAVSGRQAEAASHDSAAIILLQVRLPRVLLAFMVGGCLAAVGVGLQALLRNPLADPYVLGISSGAALGSAIALLLGIGTTVLAVSALPLCAFAGALISILLVYRIAVSYGHLPVHTLLLAGVILNAIFSAMIMFITSIIDPNRAFAIMSWLMGTLMAPDYPALAALAVYLLVGGLILFRQGGALNLMTLGEEPARALGVEVERVKKIVFVCAALLTGAVVSVSGLIGFVGMVVPHAMRLLTGADHRLLLPASALVGGMFLTAADALARTVLAPAEIPVGVVTALVGGPFFIYLLMVKKRGFMR